RLFRALCALNDIAQADDVPGRESAPALAQRLQDLSQPSSHQADRVPVPAPIPRGPRSSNDQNTACQEDMIRTVLAQPHSTRSQLPALAGEFPSDRALYAA